MGKFKRNKKQVMKPKTVNNDIETIVLKCFVRVIKDNGWYLFYRRSVQNTGVMKKLLNRQSYSSYDNPFTSCASTNDVIRTLVDITNKMTSNSSIDKYEHVTMTINHLLHFFVEMNGVGMQKLCNLGEEIYALSCFHLFGDEIEDIEEHEEKVEETEDIARLKAKIFQRYVNDISNGVISHTVTFDSYLKSELGKIKGLNGILDRMFNKDMTNPDVGIRLGRDPEEMIGREMPNGHF